MRILLYTALLAAVMLLPDHGTDVGRLIPVEVIAVSEEKGIITVTTDTGDMGQGKDLEEAFSDLKDTAPGVIYLDTAEYLVLEPGMDDSIGGLRPYLRNRVRVCYGREGIELDGIADFLSVHKPENELDSLTNTASIPIIIEENGRFRLA